MSVGKNIRTFKSLSEFKDAIISVSMRCNANDYPTEYHTYEEAWQEVFSNYDLLHKKLKVSVYEQVIDMTEQAKDHYDKDESRLGSWLVQDIAEVIRGKPPFAYPKKLYRWKRIRIVK